MHGKYSGLEYDRIIIIMFTSSEFFFMYTWMYTDVHGLKRILRRRKLDNIGRRILAIGYNKDRVSKLLFLKRFVFIIVLKRFVFISCLIIF